VIGRTTASEVSLSLATPNNLQWPEAAAAFLSSSVDVAEVFFCNPFQPSLFFRKSDAYDDAAAAVLVGSACLYYVSMRRVYVNLIDKVHAHEHTIAQLLHDTLRLFAALSLFKSRKFSALHSYIFLNGANGKSLTTTRFFCHVASLASAVLRSKSSQFRCLCRCK
jgi:hypothetical protein